MTPPSLHKPIFSTTDLASLTPIMLQCKKSGCSVLPSGFVSPILCTIMPFQRLSEIPPSSVSWLVPFWLPRGKLVILDGNPGMGKSLITLDLCARVTTGRSFFADVPDSEPAHVVLLNSEDSGADIVLPRLKALDADVDRVYIFHQGET